jgi:hypothetical protein
MKKHRLFVILVSVALVSFLLWAIIFRMRSQHELLENGVIVNARIIGIVSGGKGGNANFICEFKYDGKVYKKISATTFKGDKYALIRRSFPAMFAPKSEILEILITENDFDKFEISFPDSLKRKVTNNGS